MSLVTFLSLFLPVLVACQQAPTVQTTSGLLQGSYPHKDVTAYLGIPYAQPPIGDLRFAPPQPLPATNGSQVRDCYRSSPGCFQLDYITAFADRSTGIAESEDMLSINIWKPTNANGSLPVMIFIHGGAFTSGANGMTAYNGLEFVKRQKDIIFASINYRVNVFGFPNTPAVPEKNLGLLDQRLAVEWLRDNIKAFGGDPDRMVLSGHSAGSISVAYWSFAYVEDPIVKGFIETSGQPGLVATDDGTSWPAIANTTNCTNDNKEVELECIRKVPARSLKRAMSPNNTPAVTDTVISGGTPIVDNTTVFSLEEYASRRASGKFAKLPLLVSNTISEADGFLPFDPVSGVNTTLSDLLTLVMHHCPVAVASNATAYAGVPTWRYLYAGAFPEQLPYPWMRPFHGSDNQLILGKVEEAAYEDVSAEMEKAEGYLIDAIGAFVRDPQSGLSKYGWPKYEAGSKTLVKLFGNETAGVEFVDPASYDAACSSLGM
ncbi:Alpha/Beta hydrolase protein [Lophiotrema nucula]|uniref:Carboxylic ester hydrolase n=1 Tax=Lophiotrema nucula TaxID=690887 RepID=A0A6A5YIB7_9PLEO|nr:Alpha/Beta hydrolase protein [Lophiotrema nucula]